MYGLVHLVLEEPLDFWQVKDFKMRDKEATPGQQLVWNIFKMLQLGPIFYGVEVGYLRIPASLIYNLRNESNFHGKHKYQQITEEWRRKPQRFLRAYYQMSHLLNVIAVNGSVWTCHPWRLKARKQHRNCSISREQARLSGTMQNASHQRTT